MKANPVDATRTLRKIRVVLGLFILGLVLSGVTAFPLQTELDFAVRWLNLEHAAAGGVVFSSAAAWVLKVRTALDVTYARFPFIAYGTDWLAFGHLIIALFFVAPMRDPVRNIAVLHTGMWACVFVLPLALICGPIRGVPFFWRLIDCSFGLLGFPLLWYCVRLIRTLPANGVTALSDDPQTPTAARTAPPSGPPVP